MGIQYFDGNWHVYTRYEVVLLSQKNAENYSDVAIDLWIGNDSGGYRIEFDPTYGAYLGVQFAGDTQYVNISDLFISGNEKSLGRLTFRVYHDDDGQASRTISIWSGSTEGIKFDGWYVGNLSVSFTETFKKIPRMSTVSSVEGSRLLGEKHVIILDRKVESFKHQVWYKVWGSDWIEIGKGLGNRIEFIPSLEYARKNINVSVSTFDISVRTFDGDKQIGRDEYSNGWSIQLPSNVKPKLQTIELTDKAKATKDIVGKNTFVQTFSEMVGTFKGMEGTYGSTIKSYHAEVVGQKMAITSNGETFSIFKNYGDYNVEAYVIDSRGLKSNVVTVPIKVIQYFAPVLSFEAFRGGGDQQSIIVRRNLRIAPIMIDGVQKNTLTLKFKTKQSPEGYFMDNSGAGITSKVINQLTNSNAQLNGTFGADKSWIVEGTISDAYTSYTFTAPIVGPESVVLSYTPNGIGVGKIHERGSIDAKGDIYSHNELVQVGRLTQINGKSIKLTGSANNCLKTGMYYVSAMTDLPEGLSANSRNGYLSVTTHSEDDRFILQTYVPNDMDIVYFRRKTPRGWQKWAQIKAGEPLKGWQNANLQNGWRHATNTSTIQYYKTSEGTVYFRGVCTGGRTSGETVLFNLPVEYRPERYMYRQALNKTYGVAIIGIEVGGNVTVKDNVDNEWLCLDDISFKI